MSGSHARQQQRSAEPMFSPVVLRASHAPGPMFPSHFHARASVSFFVVHPSRRMLPTTLCRCGGGVCFCLWEPASFPRRAGGGPSKWEVVVAAPSFAFPPPLASPLRACVYPDRSDPTKSGGGGGRWFVSFVSCVRACLSREKFCWCAPGMCARLLLCGCWGAVCSSLCVAGERVWSHSLCHCLAGVL